MTTFRAWTGRAAVVAATTISTTMALAGVSFADTLQDTIADNGTGVRLEAGSTTAGTAYIRLIGNNAAGDPDSGCNIDPGESPLRLDVHVPAGVTATPDPLSIGACGQEVPVSFTASSSAVSGHATVTVMSGPAGGGTYVNQVDIPITISQPAPANTAPQVSVTGVADGATYQRSSVPTPGCSVVDAEDTGESATPTVSNGSHDDLGRHTVTCSYSDGGQPPLTGSATATYTVVRDTDTSAPVIGYTLDPADPDGAEGWYVGAVTLNWTVTEAESPETLQTTGCVDRVVSADQPLTTYSCSATSEGGSDERSVSLKRDATAPEVGYDGAVGTLGSDGWYTSPVTASFVGTDALSGPASRTQTVTSTGDGAAVTLDSPAFSDDAGNVRPAGAASSPAFKIDTQAPEAPTASLSTPANGAGWHRGDVTVSFAAAGDNGPSGVASCTSDVTVTDEGADQVVTGTCTDVAGNVSATTRVTVSLDRTAPTVSSEVTIDGTRGDNGWYTSDVDVTFTARDALSGPATATGTVSSSGEGSSVQVGSPAFTDAAGNTVAAGAVTTSVRIDATPPTAPTFNGGPGATYYYGNDPAAPTCSSTDAVSGLAGCVVTGGGSSVGTHTYTATATDNAGNTSTSTRSYTVLPWTIRGFFSPVDMGGVWNTVKGGSTVPLKFELFAGVNELTSTTAVRSFRTLRVGCASGAGTEDAIEVVSTGGTSLRYDSTAGQFIQNWKTPTGAGTCYAATMTSADGSSVTALFKIR